MARRNRRVDEFALMDLSLRAGPATAAARARELLAAGRLPERASRADLLVELGRYLDLSGDPHGAESAFREALAEGGARLEDPRLRLADLLARTGDRATADELWGEVWRARPSDSWVYYEVAEVLHRLGDDNAALRWVNTGAFRTLKLDERPGEDALALLSLRRQLRLDTGFTEDEYDVLAAEWLWEDDDLEADS